MSKIPKLKQNNKSLINQNATKLKPDNKAFYLRLDFTYLDVSKQCFSNWENAQLIKLSRYIDRAKHKEQKDMLIGNSGDDCTEQLKRYMDSFKMRFSEEIEIKAKHLYIGGGKNTKERLHGFIQSNVFYAIRLDRNHDIN